MPTYAILGATGNVGTCLLHNLLFPLEANTTSPPPTIHAFVRSRSKLAHLLPSTSTAPNLKVFEGSISSTASDNTPLTDCLRGVSTAFLAVAVNQNVPGCSVALDTAVAVVAALEQLKSEDAAFRPPHLVVLSSASLDDKFWEGTPGFVHGLLWKAMSNIYEDLERAEKFLRGKGEWIPSTFIMPGGLVHDAAQGHALSTTTQQTFISFADLAAGMIEVAEQGAERWDGAHVSVVLQRGKTARVEWWAPPTLFRGLVTHYWPGLHGWLGWAGW